MVRIRLKKTGAKNWISFRVVATDIRSSRDGYTLETLGFYDPKQSNEKLDVERTEYWLSQGAQMSETVADITSAPKRANPRSEALLIPIPRKRILRRKRPKPDQS